MTERTRSILIRYGSAVLCGLIFVVSFLAGNDFLAQDQRNMIRLLSDAFMLPGFFMLAVAAMIWLANEGALDGLTFVVTRAIKFLFPFGRGTKDENYGEYVERQRKKPVTGYGFLFITGGAFLAISLVFVWLFHL